jgi:hypothetical protein
VLGPPVRPLPSSVRPASSGLPFLRLDAEMPVAGAALVVFERGERYQGGCYCFASRWRLLMSGFKLLGVDQFNDPDYGPVVRRKCALSRK